MVGVYINTMKTTFKQSFDYKQVFLDYTFTINQREAFFNRQLYSPFMFICIHAVYQLDINRKSSSFVFVVLIKSPTPVYAQQYIYI